MECQRHDIGQGDVLVLRQDLVFTAEKLLLHKRTLEIAERWRGVRSADGTPADGNERSELMTVFT